jgi:hypothetical protein
MNLSSQLVEVLNPFGEFAFTDTPLATDLEESGRTLDLNHAVQRSRRHLQRLGRLFESQKMQRGNIIFHRRDPPYPLEEQWQCHDVSEYSHPFIGKRSSVAVYRSRR